MSLFNRKKEEKLYETPEEQAAAAAPTQQPNLGSKILTGAKRLAKSELTGVKNQVDDSKSLGAISRKSLASVNSQLLTPISQRGEIERGDSREVVDDETGAIVRFPGRIVIDSRTGKPIRKQLPPSRSAHVGRQVAGSVLANVGATLLKGPKSKSKSRSLADLLGGASNSEDDFGFAEGSDDYGVNHLFQQTEPERVAKGIEIIGVIGNGDGLRVRWDGEELDLYTNQRGGKQF